MGMASATVMASEVVGAVGASEVVVGTVGGGLFSDDIMIEQGSNNDRLLFALYYLVFRSHRQLDCGCR